MSTLLYKFSIRFLYNYGSISLITGTNLLFSSEINFKGVLYREISRSLKIINQRYQ